MDTHKDALYNKCHHTIFIIQNNKSLYKMSLTHMEKNKIAGSAKVWIIIKVYKETY